MSMSMSMSHFPIVYVCVLYDDLFYFISFQGKVILANETRAKYPWVGDFFYFKLCNLTDATKRMMSKIVKEKRERKGHE